MEDNVAVMPANRAKELNVAFLDKKYEEDMEICLHCLWFNYEVAKYCAVGSKSFVTVKPCLFGEIYLDINLLVEIAIKNGYRVTRSPHVLLVSWDFPKWATV